MRLWKWIGVAGIAGVAATGVILTRQERARRAYTADDVRARLHDRAAQLAAEPEPAAEKSGLLAGLRDRLRGAMNIRSPFTAGPLTGVRPLSQTCRHDHTT